MPPVSSVMQSGRVQIPERTCDSRQDDLGCAACRGVGRPAGSQPRAEPRVVDELAEDARQRVEVAGRHEPTAVVGDNLWRAAGVGGHDRARPTGALRRTPRRTARDLHWVDRTDRPPASAAARRAARRESARAARARGSPPPAADPPGTCARAGAARRRQSTASTRPSSRRRPSARTRLKCPFHGSSRLALRMTTSAGPVPRSRRSSARAPVRDGGTVTGGWMTVSGTPGCSARSGPGRPRAVADHEVAAS